jgi:hypothetical protein
MNIQKSPGTDKIHLLFLRKCAKSISKPLCIIFNRSYETETLLEFWLEANITPFFFFKFCFPKGVGYEKRLEKIILKNLGDRRFRGDLINTLIEFKCFRAINNIDKISCHHEPERIGITPEALIKN